MKAACSKRRPTKAEEPVPTLEPIDVQKVISLFDAGEINLVCVIGPTASGKSAFASSLREQSGGRAEIIEADSRKACDEGQNLYTFQRDFEQTFNEILSRGGIPVLCGGSPMYISAAVFAHGIDDVPPNPELRAELEEADIEELREKYAELRPVDREVMASRNKLIRALEIAFYEQEHHISKSSYTPKKAFFIGLLPDRDELERRIDKRLDEQLEQGLVSEVQALLEQGITPEELSRHGLEYKYAGQHIQGILSYDDMVRQTRSALHQRARKQIASFRNLEKEGAVIHWTRPEASGPAYES